MKVAIVQDELVRKGGAEQVVLSFQAAFPNAEIFTLSYNADKTYPEFRKSTIHTSWFGKFVKGDKNLKRFFFPFGVLAMRMLAVKGYDVVLLSTTHCAKYVQIDKKSLVLTYCHTPFRLVWRPDSYEQVKNAGAFKKIAYNCVINILRKIDEKSARRTDFFITNAREVVPRILAAYHPKNPVAVINPAVKCANFYVSEPSDYYLLVSRFEPYKKVDLVIDAFNKLNDKKLIIVGTGSMEAELKKQAGRNISFLQGLDSEKLAKLYSGCKALVFPQHEDYGITPLEANASGRPVIAYGAGGVLETMIPYADDAVKATAIFFKEQTVESLIEAVQLSETLHFDTNFIRSNAERFDENVFKEELKKFVLEKYNEQK